jgi:hypothetical protein
MRRGRLPGGRSTCGLTPAPPRARDLPEEHDLSAAAPGTGPGRGSASWPVGRGPTGEWSRPPGWCPADGSSPGPRGGTRRRRASGPRPHPSWPSGLPPHRGGLAPGTRGERGSGGRGTAKGKGTARAAGPRPRVGPARPRPAGPRGPRHGPAGRAPRRHRCGALRGPSRPVRDGTRPTDLLSQPLPRPAVRVPPRQEQFCRPGFAGIESRDGGGARRRPPRLVARAPGGRPDWPRLVSGSRAPAAVAGALAAQGGDGGVTAGVGGAGWHRGAPPRSVAAPASRAGAEVATPLVPLSAGPGTRARLPHPARRPGESSRGAHPVNAQRPGGRGRPRRR